MIKFIVDKLKVPDGSTYSGEFIYYPPEDGTFCDLPQHSKLCVVDKNGNEVAVFEKNSPLEKELLKNLQELRTGGKMKITKEMWKAYREVQDSGVTNMLDITLVAQLSGLEKDQVLYIIKNYQQLHGEYE